MVALEGRPLSEPEVQQGYQDVIHCLSQINQGIGIGTTCESGPTPVLVSLVSAQAGVDRVSLRWYADGPGLAATVERRAGDEDWVAIGSVTADGEGYLAFEDRDVRGGTRYDYRLAVGSGAGVDYMGEVRVDVPGHDVLAFLGARSLPGDGRIAITFSLASREPARLEVLDVAGRRIVSEELAGWEPGGHTLELTQSKRFPSGIYLVRILQGRARVTGKVALVR
jgi:hypothetical protein